MYGAYLMPDAAQKLQMPSVSNTNLCHFENNEDFADLPIIRSILEHNLGDIGSVNDNDSQTPVFSQYRRSFT